MVDDSCPELGKSSEDLPGYIAEIGSVTRTGTPAHTAFSAMIDFFFRMMFLFLLIVFL